MNRSRVLSTVRFATLLTLLASLVCSVGCKHWSHSPALAWLPGHEDPPETPASVVAVWTNAQSQNEDGTINRGFGGRLMFYGSKNDKPVRVSGTVVVYAFDEQNKNDTNPQADRKYVFTSEQLAKLYSKSKLGHSYSIWVPWDKAGGTQQQVSLIVRFNPEGGASVVGSQSKMTLPGRTMVASETAPDGTHRRDMPSEEAGQAETADRVRPASHYAPVPPKRIGARAADGKRQMQTTTIPLPPKGG
jgi:hypothetical protein